ncbi:MAG: four helix bundle protein [Opitutales bacterium]
MREQQDGDTFEKLTVWQRALAISIEMYRLLESCKDWGFKDQVTRSTNSIADNIAEGAERPGKAEFKQFLGYAKGSAGESRCQVYRAQALGYIAETDSNRLVNELMEISKMIHGLRNSLK